MGELGTIIRLPASAGCHVLQPLSAWEATDSQGGIPRLPERERLQVAPTNRLCAAGHCVCDAMRYGTAWIRGPKAIVGIPKGHHQSVDPKK